MKYDKLPDNDKLYIGIDQSLACTSICFMQSQTIEIVRIKPLYMGVSRTSEIYDAFCRLLDARTGQIEGAAIEGYAYSAKGAVFNLGELGGVLRLALYQRQIRTIEVPPTFLKKMMTGKGTSPKNLMLKEAYKKYGVDIDDDNDSDAFALAIAAETYFEEEYHAVKAYRHDTHKNCKQVIGTHPKPLNIKEYFAGMPNVTISEYEKQRKATKKELND